MVAVLDTGLGQHPWFDFGVERHPDGSASSLGVTFPAGADPEDDGVTLDPVNGRLDRLAGHGTFIAGVVRQHCPDARILSVPVMWGDGVADEVDVVRALTGLYARQLLAVRDGDEPRAIHVVTLSLGYRHETPGAFDDEEALFRALRALAALGVTVVAAAGNDASDVEFFPAALRLARHDGCADGERRRPQPRPTDRVGVLEHRSVGPGLPRRDLGGEHHADDLQRLAPQPGAAAVEPVGPAVGPDPRRRRLRRLQRRLRGVERDVVRGTGARR